MIDSNFWENKNILITGGAGFIGSHLVERLLQHHANVTVIDNFSRGKTVFNGATYLNRDLSLRYSGSFILDKIDVLFHLAAKVTSIEYNRFHNYDMLMTNLAINYNVARMAEEIKPKLFCFTSTACVYPHNAPVPTPENCAQVCDPEPTNFGYGVAKWVGEQIAQSLQKEIGVNSLIFRFFNAFGLRDYYDEATSHVAPALIKRIVDGENPVIVWGTGEQTRALVDAADLAKGMMLLAEVAYNRQENEPLTVNIGHEREVSIKELAETIIQLTGSIAKLQFDLSKPDGYARRAADTTLMRSLVNWIPDTPLEETLGKMIKEYQVNSRY